MLGIALDQAPQHLVLERLHLLLERCDRGFKILGHGGDLVAARYIRLDDRQVGRLLRLVHNALSLIHLSITPWRDSAFSTLLKISRSRFVAQNCTIVTGKR